MAAKLTGLQQYPRLAQAVGARDGGVGDAAHFLAAMFEGMGDSAKVETSGDTATVRQEGLRIARGIGGDECHDLIACWTELWKGCIASHRAFMDVAVMEDGDGLLWTITA